jgi:predicted DNA-binding WGR domain protein
MFSRQLIYQDGKSNKFWNIYLSGDTYTVQFGRIGTQGQQQTKRFSNPAEAQLAFEKIVAKKYGKGYIDAEEAYRREEEHPLQSLVDQLSLEDARLFGAECAAHVLHLFEKKFPDQRWPRVAIERARFYTTGECPDKLLREAYQGAEQTSWAVWQQFPGEGGARAAALAAAYSAFLPSKTLGKNRPSSDRDAYSPIAVCDAAALAAGLAVANGGGDKFAKAHDKEAAWQKGHLIKQMKKAGYFR